MEAVVVLLLIGAAVWWYASRRQAVSGSAPAPPVSRPVQQPRTVPSRSVRARESGRDARWIPLGVGVNVASLNIPGGVYVGGRLDAVSGYGVDPALIDPRLPVNLRRPDTFGRDMGYWPSYETITPESRAAYLNWLAAGRPAGAYIGYVFLFFYGIERRVILDAPRSQDAAGEMPELLREVERLLGLYTASGSFQGYATNFLTTARLVHQISSTDDLKPPRKRVGWEVPLEVKIAVGAQVAAGEPIPAEWALAWALNDQEIPLRTPATRCEDEFAELFAEHYRAAYGEGMVIKPNKTRLRLEYRPASASFRGAVTLDTGDLPDVTRLARPKRLLAEIVQQTTEELDAFSRYVGRSDDRTSPRAVAQLPPLLASRRELPELEALAGETSTQPSIVSSSILTGLLRDAPAGKLPKRDAQAVANLLASRGLAVEPDVRFGPTNFSHHEQAVIWRDEEPSAEPGDDFAGATVLLHLGAMVSSSDGEVSTSEQRHLESQLATAFALPEPGRRRLQAHLAWLLAAQPGQAGVKARVRALPFAARGEVARFLLSVAAADGHVSPREVAAIERFYRLLDLDASAIHSDLHALGANEPVRVLDADADQGDRPITEPVELDAERLAAVVASTHEVGQVLAGVFEQDDEPNVSPEPEENEIVGEPSVAGLDGPHSRLVRTLAGRPTWPRPDFDALAAEFGLLPAGALETLNDAAFACADAPLAEGDDPLELDGFVLKEMLDG